jgi:hypothetical protein
LPLVYSSGGLIHAVARYDIEPDALYSLVVSGPETGPSRGRSERV